LKRKQENIPAFANLHQATSFSMDTPIHRFGQTPWCPTRREWPDAADSVEKLDVGMSFWAPAMFDAGDPGRYFVVLDRGCCPTRH
jgi:hypothetical protein